MLSGVAWLVSEARVLASAEVADDVASSGAAACSGGTDSTGRSSSRPCRWVHTIGMRFPIDVAYVDDDGVVIKMVRMRRWRIGVPVKQASLGDRGATGAFERWGLSRRRRRRAPRRRLTA